jgi:hypothetical protein
MPNTLAHIGIQTPLTRLGLKEAPLQWIMIGCIIPDIPWIVQRIFKVIPIIAPLDLRLYAITQSSLVYCLLLSLALATLTRNSRQIFLILAGNSLFHLLLDATQKKWGNGVNLFVPFSWHTTNFNLFWPEHSLNYFFMGAGLLVFLMLWPKAVRNDLLLQKPCRTKAFCTITCLILYFASPILLTNTAYSANIHYSKTLHDIQTRTGKELELDRAKYSAASQSLECYIGKHLEIANPPPMESGTISIRGHFLDDNTIELQDYHIHKNFRDSASYIGLFLTLLLWTHSFIHQKAITPFHRTHNE